VGESGDCTLWTDGGNSVLILLLTEMLCCLLYLLQHAPEIPVNSLHSLAVVVGCDRVRYCGHKGPILPDPDGACVWIIVSGFSLTKVRK
jgi:hypothetical protein